MFRCRLHCNGWAHRIDVLNARPGYGVSFFPKDTLALLKMAEDYESPDQMVEAVVKVKESWKRAMGRKVIDELGEIKAARGKMVKLLGLTFKPNTEDIRTRPRLPSPRVLTDAW